MKSALITGATSGIGEALACLLASKGYTLILTGRNQQKLETIAHKLKAHKSVVADLECRDQRDLIVNIIREELPDLLINNAGFGIYGDALTIPVKNQLAILEVDAAAPLELTLEAVRAWAVAGRRGIVMNISSVSGEIPCPGMSVYGASKAFLTYVSSALNTELDGKGIHVLVSCPGMVSTDFAERAAGRPIVKKKGPEMSSEYAANQIWEQIEKRQEKRIFNSTYRLASFFANIIPKAWVKKMIWNQIQERL